VRPPWRCALGLCRSTKLTASRAPAVLDAQFFALSPTGQKRDCSHRRIPSDLPTDAVNCSKLICSTVRGRNCYWRTTCPRPTLLKFHLQGTAVGQPPHLPRNEDLLAFTGELGPVVSLAHWRRADCCDTIVANGAIGWFLSGIVRKSLILESGQRRIVDLMMAGDFFGLRMDDSGLFCFEASTGETLTARISRRDFKALAGMQPSLFQFFHERACQPSPASRSTFWFRAAQPRHRRSRAIFCRCPDVCRNSKAARWSCRCRATTLRIMSGLPSRRSVASLPNCAVRALSNSKPHSACPCGTPTSWPTACRTGTDGASRSEALCG
jgi:CRP-like cAMP-binding protein